MTDLVIPQGYTREVSGYSVSGSHGFDFGPDRRAGNRSRDAQISLHRELVDKIFPGCPMMRDYDKRSG